MHEEIENIPNGDLIIHAGDVTEYGTEEELQDFILWFSKLPHKYKIFIAGNHDLCLQQITQLFLIIYQKILMVKFKLTIRMAG
jgi:predicted phosphodiesterase